MENSTWRVMAMGAILALVVVAGLVGAMFLGVIPAARNDEMPTEMLAILTAPDKDGAQVAALPMLLRSVDGSITTELVDAEIPVQVPGTSAKVLKDAYPFGGGQGVADAYGRAVGSEHVAWVAVPPPVWTSLVDEAGGIEVDVPTGVSAYGDGRLTILEPGPRRLSGEEAVALASSLDFLDETVQARTRKELQSALGAVLADRLGELDRAVEAGKAATSIKAPDAFSRFGNAQP